MKKIIIDFLRYSYPLIRRNKNGKFRYVIVIEGYDFPLKNRDKKFQAFKLLKIEITNIFNVNPTLVNEILTDFLNM